MPSHASDCDVTSKLSENAHRANSFWSENSENYTDLIKNLSLKLECSPKIDHLSVSHHAGVEITPLAYLTMVFHAIKYASMQVPRESWVEVIGLLIGNIFNKDTLTERILVEEAYPIGYGNATYVQISDYSILPEVLERKKFIVGWYHSHPSYGLFMSREDYQTQLRYQQHWNKAIAVVIDPTLISSVNFGIDVFRLDQNLEYFTDIQFEIVRNFKPHSLPELVKSFFQ